MGGRYLGAAAWRPALVRQLAVMTGVLALLAPGLIQRLQTVDIPAIWAAVARVPLADWALALVATLASYLAVAGYDRTMHRHLATGIDPGRAGRAGVSALAIGQMVGLGVLSGALVRWRMLPDLGATGALRLSGAVSASFLWAWAVLTLAALWVFPAPVDVPAAPVLMAALLGPAVLGPILRVSWAPNLLTMLNILGLSAMDCLAACIALWAVLPGAVGFGDLVPVFLLALGAGLLSGAPGGIGAFELVLLAGLPGLDLPRVLAATLAWRLVYLALPAGVGAVLALRSGPRKPVSAARPMPRTPPPEAALIGQGGLAWHPQGFVAGRTPHALVALTGGVDPAAMRRAARAEGRVPVLYKLSARQAVAARRQGFRLLPVAVEAWLDPARFCDGGAGRAGLRRKLRRAESAGVKAALDLSPDRQACARVNAAWVRARGRERGFSMGRFAVGRLGDDPTIVARQHGCVVGFATFLAGWEGGQPVWVLDLLRPDPAAPDGTAQAMIRAALAAARAAGVARLSLAAVPISAVPGEAGLIARLERRLCPRAGDGLWQFKAGFAPDWQRRYIAAPGWLSLAVGGAEIARAVLRPTPDMRETPRCDAEYEFASASAAWQGKGSFATEGPDP